MSDVVQSVRQLLQDFIAPEFRELKGDVKLVDTKIDSEAGQLRADIRRLEGKVDSGFAQMRSLLENASLRAELEAARDIANLRERGSSRQ